MKKAKGHVIYTPLSYIFSMLEMGGSSVQQYDKYEKEYEPDRSLVPYVLQPKLVVKDSDGVIANGDVTAFIVNAVWTVNVIEQDGKTTTVSQGNGRYTVDSLNAYKLTMYLNCSVTETIVISFRCDYVDSRRGETQHFTWEKKLTSQKQTKYNFSLSLSTPKKTTLSPFKNRGTFDVTARVMNGTDEVTDKATIKWYLFVNDKYIELNSIDDDTEDVDYYPLWFNWASGEILNINQNRIQDVIVKCIATIEGQEMMEVFRMIRRYGQYEESIDLLEGGFIKPGQTKAHVEVTVANRQGVIASPEDYFDIEIFHSCDGETWTGVMNGTSYVMEDSHLAESDHQFGTKVRELTAEIPITMPDGSPLALPDGSLLVSQFPKEE